MTQDTRRSLGTFFSGRWGKVFILGALMVAVLGEQVVFTIKDAGGRKPAAAPITPHTVRGKITLALSQALGKSDRAARRFKIMAIRRVGDGRLDIRVRWAINNDLSAGSVGNGAEADAYLIFGHVYSLSLPIARVDVVGTYPVAPHSAREIPVMRLWLNRKTASVVASGGWGSIDGPTLWPLIHRTYVAADFEPIPSE